jgi:hypothetical protein
LVVSKISNTNGFQSGIKWALDNTPRLSLAKGNYLTWVESMKDSICAVPGLAHYFPINGINTLACSPGDNTKPPEDPVNASANAWWSNSNLSTGLLLTGIDQKERDDLNAARTIDKDLSVAEAARDWFRE